MILRKAAAPFTLLLFLAFSGCGGGGGGNDTASVAQGSGTTMTAGRSYALKEGDRIVKRSPDAQVLLETDLNTGETTATLISGSAAIEE
ncbi:hypothetical protein [Hydrogenimonas sp. SS33]|uniref:hypothetical protein n=1 Tax=Hydrogenimonas leucolamina TaxID=2954236 RepID=UPI00336C00CA